MEHNHTAKEKIIYTCVMHPEVIYDKPGVCPKCGMTLIKVNTQEKNNHSGHVMGNPSKMSFWGKFKMSMSMTMGMDHTGLAEREVARLMELDIKNKFFSSGD